MKIQDIAQWNEGKALSTKNGPRVLRTATPGPQFWEAWKIAKNDLKNAGVSVAKNGSQWVAQWWMADASAQQDAAKVFQMSKAGDTTFTFPVPAGLTPMPFQQAGVEFLMGRANALLADEMGLGKTIQAIGVINADATIAKVLVVCPASLKLNWKAEITKWQTRGLTVGVATGKEFPDTQVVVINYDITAKHADSIHGVAWDLLILDEAHYVKNPDAKRTSTLLGKWNRDASKVLPAVKARRKIAITGTPIPNRPKELFGLLNFLAPGAFGGFLTYAKQYCAAYQDAYGWQTDGASNLDELQSRLRSTVMVRRLKDEVLKELPAKIRQIIPMEGFEALVKQEQELLAKLGVDPESDWDAFVASLRAGAVFEEMSALRKKLALAKAPAVIEHVRDLLESGESKVIVMAHHKDVVDLITAAFDGAVVKVDGGTPVEARQAAVEQFQTNPEVKVFVGNIIAAGVGLTLTASRTVVFAELDWVPGNVVQAEDRAHRIGQQDTVLIQYLVVDGSLDSRLAQVLQSKAGVIRQALDGGEFIAQDAQDAITEVPGVVTLPDTDKTVQRSEKAVIVEDAEVCPF